MQLSNYHSHCTFCDGRSTPEDFVKFAVAHGFRAYGFSSHSPLPFETFWNMSKDDMPEYLTEIERLKKKYNDRLEIYVGLEIDFLDKSYSVAPAIVGASLEMFKMLKESDALHTKLMNNVSYFREKMLAAGFDIKPTQSAICAVMLYDAKLSQDFAAKMQEEGIYVTGFYYPVVPKDQARIRVQLSAGHETEHLDKAIEAFIKVGKELNVIK